MTTQELLTKTFDFSRGVSNLKHLVPHATYLPQLLDAAAQVGIHYRAAQRTNSPEEFTRKIRMVADAAERSLFYLQLISAEEIYNIQELDDLVGEAKSLFKISMASLHTMTKKQEGMKKKEKRLAGSNFAAQF